MFAAERRGIILEHLRAHGPASLRELAAVTDTSEVTVRRDLRALEAEGRLRRPRGGAMLEDHHAPSYWKARVAPAEKAAIAATAAALVADGDSIVLGAGTTTKALAEALVHVRDLTVVTNSLLAADVLARARGVEVVVTGGTLRGPIYALVGSAAERSLAGLSTARAFISGNGLTAARGLSTPSLEVANVDRALAAAAREVVVLVDHTKVGHDTMCQTVDPERIGCVVTDERADPVELDALGRAGVEVRVAAVQPAAVG